MGILNSHLLANLGYAAGILKSTDRGRDVVNLGWGNHICELIFGYRRREGDVGWEKFWGYGKGCQELKGKGFSLID